MRDLQNLSAFLAVAELASFSAAAKRLKQSPPTITRLIAELEASLGVQLFVRTTRRVSLTRAGQLYRDEVAPLLAGLARADEAVRAEQHGLAGQLRINAPMSFGQKFLPTAVARFRILYPEVNITLALDDAFIDINTGQYDMALRISELPKDKSAIWQKLCPIPRLLVASPHYLSARGRPQEAGELAGHACLGYGEQGQKAVWRLRQRSIVNIETFCFFCNNGDVLADVAAEGEGIALLPQFIVADHMKAGRLVQVLANWQAPQIWLIAYYPPYTRPPAKVKVFTAFIADAMAATFAEPEISR